jgi:hypothetical protein
MAFERTGGSVVQAIRYHGEFNPITSTNTVDKRPFLFPFLEAVVHLLCGFAPSNPFWLNGFLMFVFLAAVFIGARQFVGGLLSAAAVFLVISYPDFSNCGTSGGYEMLASVYLGLSLCVLYVFLGAPTSEKFALLWMNLVALSQTRHESFMFFFIVFGLMIAIGRFSRSCLKDNFLLVAMTPLWFLLSVWGPIVNAQYVEDPLEKHIFSLQHFQHNFLEFLRAQIDFSFVFPYNNILNLLAVLLLAYLFLEIVIRKRAFQAAYQSGFSSIWFACILATVVVPFSFYGGTSLHPAGVRHFLPLSIMCALLPVLWVETLSSEVRGRISVPYLLGSINLFLLYHPIAVEGRFVNLSYPYRETTYELKMLEKLYPDQNVLVVAEIPSQFTALQYGAIDFDTADKNVPNFLAGLARHLYRDIAVIQRIQVATQAPAPKNQLDPAYILQTIDEYETDPDNFIRISRVILPPRPFSRRSD